MAITEERKNLLSRRKEDAQLNINTLKRALNNDVQHLQNIKNDIMRIKNDIKRNELIIKNINEEIGWRK